MDMDSPSGNLIGLFLFLYGFFYLYWVAIIFLIISKKYLMYLTFPGVFYFGIVGKGQ